MKKFDREVVGAFKAGSHMRNLQNSNSDEDWKYFVLPTREDLFSGKVFKHVEISDTIDIEVQDVRRLDHLLYKSNPAYLDLLFSPQIEYFGHEELWQILQMRDEIATINLSSLWDTTMGMFNQNMKELTRTTAASGTKVVQYIEKHGYNPKKAMMNIHLATRLVKFKNNEFTNYGECIWYESKEKELMLDIKSGKLSLKLIENSLDDFKEHLESLKRYYKEHPVNEETHQKLQQLLRQLVFKNVMDCNISVK